MRCFHVLLVVSVLLSAFVCGGCLGPSKMEPAAEPTELPILWEKSGTYSNIARPLRVVIRDEATLAQLPLAEVPVDFRRQMVLVAATGPAYSDQIGVQIVRVWDDGKKVRVRVDTLHPGEEKHGGVVRTSPYHIVVVPRNDHNVEGFSAAVPAGAVALPSAPVSKGKQLGTFATRSP